MRKLTMISLAAMACGLAACGDDGYYDNDGVWHYYSAQSSRSETVRGPHAAPNRGTPVYNYTFTRRGYYDEYGNFVQVSVDDDFYAAPAYYPGRGMCRVWFTDRAPEYQPAIQPCARIRASGVPSGAYVIYGG